MSSETMENLATLCQRLGFNLDSNWKGLDAVWPMVELIRGDGGVVVIKVDGQRTSEEDNGAYTVVISGGGLKGDYVSTERSSLEDCLEHCIREYVVRCWL
ncbi:MAG: hypothetical protein JNL67_18760 [Planctomycetaceae bacterium]|nr:hypothetical protein [Planctomycetaceae bacterium]